MTKKQAKTQPTTSALNEGRLEAIQKFKDIMSRVEEECEELQVQIDQLQNAVCVQPTAFDWADVARANELLHGLQALRAKAKQK